MFACKRAHFVDRIGRSLKNSKNHLIGSGQPRAQAHCHIHAIILSVDFLSFFLGFFSRKSLPSSCHPTLLECYVPSDNLTKSLGLHICLDERCTLFLEFGLSSRTLTLCELDI